MPLPAMTDYFDLIVLGAGSGGLAAAKRAASYGASVAIVEGDRVGGTCVIRGCVPKKLLVYGSAYRHLLADAASYGWRWMSVGPTPPSCSPTCAPRWTGSTSFTSACSRRRGWSWCAAGGTSPIPAARQ